MKVSVCVLAMLGSALAHAHTSDEEDLAQVYGDQQLISLATGSTQKVSRAPSTASVITAHDIQAMGATDLDQVLETVPGLHVSMWNAPLNPIYSFRGIHTDYNAQVLMLVNGIPITNVFTGNRGQVWGGMPLENVARVEVIRGPGSALYGADAFSGVINVITKTSEDIKGTEYGLRAGSFGSRDAWVLHGAKAGPLDAAFYLGVGQTDGYKGLIAQDAIGRSGAINAMREAVDARADLAYADWRLRVGYQHRIGGIGMGLAGAVDQNGRAPENRWYLDLNYTRTSFAPNWDVSGVLGHYDVKNEVGSPAYTLFPAGAIPGFPNGVIGNPGHYERHTHGSVSVFFSGFDKHRVRVGLGFRIEDLYKAMEQKNFNLATGFAPLDGVIDATDNPTLVYLLPHKRDLKYAFVQDEWNLTRDWTLTAGVRHDDYSDFGGTTNPRLALVWDAAYNLVIKAMHGRAFRAPNFTELYNINNPVNLGNARLNPETIETDELAFSWQPGASVQTNLTVFRYRMGDIIRLVPNTDPTTGATAQNIGTQTGNGMELEATWDATRKLRLSGSFSLQRSTDDKTQEDAGLAPRRHWVGRADWQFAPQWQLGAVVNQVAERMRQSGDKRTPVPDYTTVDLSLRRANAAGNWEVRALVRNLFDSDVREPTTLGSNIPSDMPMPGRGLYLQFQHKL